MEWCREPMNLYESVLMNGRDAAMEGAKSPWSGERWSRQILQQLWIKNFMSPFRSFVSTGANAS